MILDARKGDTGYRCFDVKRCRVIKTAVWVDDSTACWGEIILTFPGGVVSTRTIQEDRITIYPDKRLVLFNEVDDEQAGRGTLEELLVAPTLPLDRIA